MHTGKAQTHGGARTAAKPNAASASRPRPLILHIFPSFNVGGAQRRFAQIAGATGGAFNHTVLSIDGNYEADTLVRGIAHAPPASRNGNIAARLLRYRKYLHELKPQLVVTYNWGAIEWAMASAITGVAHVQIEDGFGPDEIDKQEPRRVWTRRLVLSRSRAVVVPSRLLESLAKATWKVSKDKLIYIPNGVDTLGEGSLAGRSPIRRDDLNLPVEAIVVGWVGALRREKNVARLVSAFASMPQNARLVLIGEGPERPNLEAQIGRLNLAGRIHFLGERRDVECILPVLDILALSSDTEQMPIVVLEAMAASLPIASTDVGDVKAMVAPENLPFIVERSDAAMAGALSALSADPALRRSIGAANRARLLAQFRKDQMIDAYVGLFRRLTLPAGNS